MPNEQPETINIQLTKFINSHLGRGNFISADGSVYYDRLFDCRPIDEETARAIIEVTGNSHTCYIQWPDKWSPHLKEPVLWEYTAWVNQVDKWKREAERSRIEREQRFIREANEKNLIKAVMKETELDYENSRMIVRAHMNRGGWEKVAKAFNVTKIITSVEEL